MRDNVEYLNNKEWEIEEIKERLRKAMSRKFRRTTCFCGEPLSLDKINMCDHDNGYKIKGKNKRQWVTIECKNKKCKQNWTPDTLGFFERI
ncbi:hypothetical protein HYX17_02545 [Candidatus Woesearchaeota archaeon]|nr:hypothetical protein [Candidatus Woesearchaeota archaeon]